MSRSEQRREENKHEHGACFGGAVHRGLETDWADEISRSSVSRGESSSWVSMFRAELKRRLPIKMDQLTWPPDVCMPLAFQGHVEKSLTC